MEKKTEHWKNVHLDWLSFGTRVQVIFLNLEVNLIKKRDVSNANIQVDHWQFNHPKDESKIFHIPFDSNLEHDLF